MCGLVGIVGKELTKKDRGIFSRLFLTNSLRGVDGCGLVSLSKKTKKNKERRYYSIDKSEDPSSLYVYTKEYGKIISDDEVYALMGHSRAATIGDVTLKNCHPFSFRKKDSDSRLVVMHNGTVRGRFPKSEEFDVDSEAVASHMAEVGIKKALEDVYEKSWNFAFAMVIYDTEGSISLIRNKDRPLFLAKSGSKIMWASEKSFIEFATESLGDDSWSIEEVPEGSLIKIFPNKDEPKERLKIIPNYYDTGKLTRSWVTSRSDNWGRLYGYGDGNYSQQQGRLIESYDSKTEDAKNNNETFRESMGRKLLSKSRELIRQVLKSNDDPNLSYDQLGLYPSDFGLYVPWVPDDKKILIDIGKRLLTSRRFESDVLSTGCSMCNGYHDHHDGMRFFFEGVDVIPLCHKCSDSLNSTHYSWESLFTAEPFYREVDKRVGLTLMASDDWYDTLDLKE